MVFLLQFVFVAFEDDIGLSKVALCESRNRVLQDLRLVKSADSEEFFNIRWRKRWDNGAPVGHDCDQSLGVELAQRLTHWNSADVILHRDRVLAELCSFWDRAANNLLAQLVCYGRG